MEKNEITIWNDVDLSRSVERSAELLSKSSLVPDKYIGKKENCLVAIDFANRTNISPLTIMQNLYFVRGMPAWSSQMAAVLCQQRGRFSPFDFNMVGAPNTDSYGCYVTATRLSDNKLITGVTVTIAMAKAESWYSKDGSKWKTMPELMLRYRAQAFFVRLNDPAALMGLQTVEEAEDIPEYDANGKQIGSVPKATIDVNALKIDAEPSVAPIIKEEKPSVKTSVKQTIVEEMVTPKVEKIKQEVITPKVTKTKETKGMDESLVLDALDTGYETPKQVEQEIIVGEKVISFNLGSDDEGATEPITQTNEWEPRVIKTEPMQTPASPKMAETKPISANSAFIDDGKHCVRCHSELSQNVIDYYDRLDSEGKVKTRVCRNCLTEIKMEVAGKNNGD